MAIQRQKRVSILRAAGERSVFETGQSIDRIFEAERKKTGEKWAALAARNQILRKSVINGFRAIELTNPNKRQKILGAMFVLFGYEGNSTRKRKLSPQEREELMKIIKEEIGLNEQAIKQFFDVFERYRGG